MTENDYEVIKTTEEYQLIINSFDLSPTRWWNKRQLTAKNTWNIPDHLSCLWDDLELVIARDGGTHPLFPMRIESLLLALLADKIKNESLHTGGSLNLPHWSFRKRILTREMEDDQILAPMNIIDYVLWYGHCWELETNMIVMKTKLPVSRSWALLQNMARIHHARKLAGRDTVIYGIMTDGIKWVFIHLTHKRRYTIKVFSWDNERDRIVAQAQDIIDQAVALHRKIISRSSLPTPTVHESRRCQIKEMPTPCKDSGDGNGRVIEENTYEMGPLVW